jgi:hypothetical protein
MGLSPWWGVRTLLVIPALAAVLMAAGCGGTSTATVSGKVSYNGSPLKAGNVTFFPKEQPPVSTRIGEDGSYSLLKVPIGEVTICVETKSVNPSRLSKIPKMNVPKDKVSPNPGTDLEKLAKLFTPIPDKYADPATSGRTYTVTSGAQTHDIDLPK